MPESPDLSSALKGNEPPKPEDPQPLKGYRRELTREVFEDLAALQCEPEEIFGYIGTSLPKLETWCRRTYRRPLSEILEAVRQDGLIQIRRASFEQLKKSATIISQQYNRFLPPPAQDDAASKAAIAALTAAISLPEDDVREVFSYLSASSPSPASSARPFSGGGRAPAMSTAGSSWRTGRSARERQSP